MKNLDGERRPLRGSTALVTGSTRGIGLAIARRLREDGADVIVHGRSPRVAETVAEDIGASWVAADLAEPTAVAGMLAELAGRQIDIVVNNAAVEPGGTLERTTPETLRETYQVNLFAPVEIVRGLLPSLRRSRRPVVVFVSSIHQSVPYFGNAAYASSKAALSMYMRTLAIELGPEGIRVNSVAPGAIATDINREVLAEIGEERFREWIPLGRVGDASEVAAVTSFLCSPDASYVHGSTLTADGAYSQHLVRYRDPSHT